MKVLITGGAGFIGSHVAKRLIERGDDVVLLDDFNNVIYEARLKEERIQKMFSKKNRPRLIVGSILQRELVDTLFREEGFDTVIHLAAHANPAVSVDATETYTAVNLLGTIIVLEAAARCDVQRFVFASTASVYNDGQTPFREDAYPLRPRSPYGASKAAAEVYCALWHDLFDLPITVLRFFSVYGPWGRPDMMPMIFADALLHDTTISLNQEERLRDFTYIDDLVEGVVVAADRQFGYETINIGGGKPVSLTDFLAALEKASGTKARVTLRPGPAGEMRVTYADISKAQRLLGYAPTVSVSEGTQRLIEWMRTR